MIRFYMVALWLHWNCNHKSEKCNSQKRVRQIGIYPPNAQYGAIFPVIVKIIRIMEIKIVMAQPLNFAVSFFFTEP